MTGDMLSFEDSHVSICSIKPGTDNKILKTITGFSIGKNVGQTNEKQLQIWLVKNKAAIESYNNSIEDNGVFSDEIRGF